MKSDYAARAVLTLARHYHTGAPLRVEQIAADQSVPANYLVQILIELKAHGIVRSMRGKQGGYLLARPPASVTLGDVLRCVHGELFDTPALQDPNCAPELREAWDHLGKSVGQVADAMTFQAMLDQAADKQKMYYI